MNKLPTYKGYKYKITGKAGDYRAMVFIHKPYLMAQSVDGSFRTKAIAIHMAKAMINRWIEL